MNVTLFDRLIYLVWDKKQQWNAADRKSEINCLMQHCWIRFHVAFLKRLITISQRLEERKALTIGQLIKIWGLLFQLPKLRRTPPRKFEQILSSIISQLGQ